MDKLEKWLMEHAKPARAEGINNLQRCQYQCQECKDTGWITIYKDGYEVMRKCRCCKIKRAKELAERSGISGEFLQKSFASFDTRGNPVLAGARNKAEGYVKNFAASRHGRHNSIMFCGQPGSGKTHLGTAICSGLIAMGISVIYMPYRNAMTRIKQHIGDEAAYSKELGIYMDADVLYIDDMLKGRLTDTDVNVMYEIISHRYMHNLPLIISTEKDLDGLLLFDEAVGSRIIEMCLDNIVWIESRELNYRMYKFVKGGA